MGLDFIPYFKPEINSEEINEVVNTLRSGWLTTGPKTKEFEVEFSKFIGKNFEAIAVNSATSGLHLALEALGVKEGDEVITTTHTFTATAEVIRYLGANPIFVDIDPNTLCIDPEKIERVITSKCKVIIPVHFAGISADINKINDIAKKHNLKVLEDAAHAFPTTYNGEKIGSLNTDITVFSFYANKTMTTGEGGMVVTKNKSLADRIKIMRSHGINRDAFDRYSSSKPKWFYEVVAPGFKYNMTDIAASLGLIQLKKLYKMQKRREEIACEYFAELKDLPIKLPSKPEKGDMHSWHLFVIQLKNAKLSRDDLINLLFKNGIGCSVHYIPLHMHPYWRDKYNLSQKNFPNSQKAYENSLSLPIYSMMTDRDTKKIICELKKLL